MPILAGILSALFLYLIQQNQGPGISHDTLLFLEAGHNFWNGDGYTYLGAEGNWEFCGSVPPLYPIILGVFNSINAVDVLQSLLFGMTAFLLFRLKIKLFRKVKYGFVQDLTAYFLILTFLILSVPFYYTAFTESLFIPLMLWLILEMTGKKRFSIIVLLLLLLSFTRVVGVTIGGAFLIYTIWKDGNWKKGFVYALASVLPVLIWIVLSKIIGSGIAREISWHPMKFKVMLKIPRHFGQWFFDESQSMITLMVGLLVLIGIVMCLIWSIRKHKGLLMLLSSFCLVYIVFIIFSISALDYATPIEDRTLMPVYIAVFVILLLLIKESSSKARMLFFAFSAILLLRITTNSKIPELEKNGFGYSSEYAMKLDYPEVIKQFNLSQPIYSTDPNVLYYFTNLESKQLPTKYNRYNHTKTPLFDKVWQTFLSKAYQKGATLIWIRSGPIEKTFVTQNQFNQSPGFSVLYSDWVCSVVTSDQNFVNSLND